MSKTGRWDSVIIALFAVFLGLIAGSINHSPFDFFFVIAVVIILYDYSERINQLKNQLEDINSKLQKLISST
jgi:Ca2+-dependent lipid-binding protein